MRNEYCTGGTQPLTKGNLMVPKNPWVEIQRLTAERDALVKALRELVDGMNCTCRLRPMIGLSVPCQTCRMREALRPYEASDARISPDKPSAR